MAAHSNAGVVWRRAWLQVVARGHAGLQVVALERACNCGVPSARRHPSHALLLSSTHPPTHPPTWPIEGMPSLLKSSTSPHLGWGRAANRGAVRCERGSRRGAAEVSENARRASAESGGVRALLAPFSVPSACKPRPACDTIQLQPQPSHPHAALARPTPTTHQASTWSLLGGTAGAQTAPQGPAQRWRPNQGTSPDAMHEGKQAGWRGRSLLQRQQPGSRCEERQQESMHACGTPCCGTHGRLGWAAQRAARRPKPHVLVGR